MFPLKQLFLKTAEMSTSKTLSNTSRSLRFLVGGLGFGTQVVWPTASVHLTSAYVIQGPFPGVRWSAQDSPATHGIHMSEDKQVKKHKTKTFITRQVRSTRKHFTKLSSGSLSPQPHHWWLWCWESSRCRERQRVELRKTFDRWNKPAKPAIIVTSLHSIHFHTQLTLWSKLFGDSHHKGITLLSILTRDGRICGYAPLPNISESKN